MLTKKQILELYFVQNPLHLQILQWFEYGWDETQIGNYLNYEPGTIKNMRKDMFGILNVDNKADACLHALCYRLITPAVDVKQPPDDTIHLRLQEFYDSYLIEQKNKKVR